MEGNVNLFNAVVIGENPETAYIVVDGHHLHAVEQRVADQKKEQSRSEKVLPLIREALKALIQFSKGKVEAHFLEIDFKSIEDQKDEKEQLIHQLHNIFTHLPHHERNDLSSLIHHKQTIS